MVLRPGPAALAAFDAGQALNALRWNVLHDAIVGGEYRAAVATTFASFRRILVELATDLDGSRLFFPGAPGLLALAKNGTITKLDDTVQVNVIAVDASDIYFADSGGGGGPMQILPGLKKMPK